MSAAMVLRAAAIAAAAGHVLRLAPSGHSRPTCHHKCVTPPSRMAGLAARLASIVDEGEVHDTSPQYHFRSAVVSSSRALSPHLVLRHLVLRRRCRGPLRWALLSSGGRRPAVLGSKAPCTLTMETMRRVSLAHRSPRVHSCARSQSPWA